VALAAQLRANNFGRVQIGRLVRALAGEGVQLALGHRHQYLAPAQVHRLHVALDDLSRLGHWIVDDAH